MVMELEKTRTEVITMVSIKTMCHGEKGRMFGQMEKNMLAAGRMEISMARASNTCMMALYSMVTGSWASQKAKELHSIQMVAHTKETGMKVFLMATARKRFLAV